MCPYLEFFWCQSPNAGEYGLEKLRIRTLHTVKKRNNRDCGEINYVHKNTGWYLTWRKYGEQGGFIFFVWLTRFKTCSIPSCAIAFTLTNYQ